jgi:hypothetical protein
MYHVNHKIWILSFTVLVFFITSFFIIPHSNNPFPLENSHSFNSSLQTNYFTAIELISGCPQQDHATSEEYELGQHHCCASICLLKVPCGQSITVKLALLATLALISEDNADKAIVRSKTLFRPPIA